MRWSYFMERKFGIVFVVLYVVLFFLFGAVIIYDNFLYFKYSLFPYIINGGMMITCLVCLIRLHLKTPLSYFQSLSAKLKLGYCIRYLCFSMCFLLSIEYLFYLKDKTCYIIEKEFLEKATQYQLNDISTNLEVYRDLKYRYKKLYGGISLSQNYGYQRIGKRIYTIINNDTVVFHLHRLNSFHPYSHFHNRGKNGDFIRCSLHWNISIL